MANNIDLTKLTDEEKCQLVDTRWNSSAEIWDTIENVYKANTRIYENRSNWLDALPERRKRYRVQANRVFVNMEAVINSLIANPPAVNILPGRDGDAAQDFARDLEKYFMKRYSDRNVKETLRMALRNMYFGRLLVIKPFWNKEIDDFDFRAIDPRKVRFGKFARKEQDSEFAIEEVTDDLCAVIARFPAKKAEILKKKGFTGEDGEKRAYILNPEITYKEAHIGGYIICKYENIILDTFQNPYWDWDGILVTEEEKQQYEEKEGEDRRSYMMDIRMQQDSRKQEMDEYNGTYGNTTGAVGPIEGDPVMKPPYSPYFFNYFDQPRKPYIFATIFNNENSPIGRTDMITLSAELQRGIDKRKMDIDENCELANGVLKVDASVMGKSDAQRIRFETKGIIWGKGVKEGVTRETGQALPQMVFDDMLDSRSEIDNIMAATSAFRGEREGQETKAGRLALIQQSFLRLNELVQVIDYVCKEIFDWGMQLAKTRYTEPHYAKWMGDDEAQKTVELMQDDFEDGSEVTIVAGKTLPVDDEFKFEQAQNDVEKGYISPIDYLEIAKYDNAKELSRNAIIYAQNPMEALQISEGDMPVPFTPGQLTPGQVASTTPQPGGDPNLTPQEIEEPTAPAAGPPIPVDQL